MVPTILFYKLESVTINNRIYYCVNVIDDNTCNVLMFRAWLNHLFHKKCLSNYVFRCCFNCSKFVCKSIGYRVCLDFSKHSL